MPSAPATTAGVTPSDRSKLDGITDVGSGEIITSDERTKVGYLSVTGAADLDDIAVALAAAAAAQADADAAQADADSAGSAAAAAAAAASTAESTAYAAGIAAVAAQGDADTANAVASTATTAIGAGGAAHLGTFTGGLIPDSQTVKQALQTVETAIETVSSGGVPDADYGDITVDSGEWTINDDAVTTSKIPDGSVTLDKLEDVAQNTVIGRVLTGTGVPAALTASELRTVAGITSIGSGEIITSGERTSIGTNTSAAAAAQTSADAAQADADTAISDAAAAQAAAGTAQGDADTANAAAAAAQSGVDALVTLSGVAAAATHLGAFTGSTIADNQTVKAAIQSLETSLEALSGVSDGDKGDITVSSGGTAWTIDNLAVTNDKLATGAVTTSKIAAGAVDDAALASDAVTTVKLANNNVTLAKLATVSTANILGRTTAGTGNVESLTATQARGVLGITDVGSGVIISSAERTAIATNTTAAATAQSTANAAASAASTAQGDADTANAVAATATTAIGAGGAAHLGSFTGTLISDSLTVKQALQSVETSIEGATYPWLMGGSYGLNGDGATDNVTALTNAITAANSQGKALFVPKGTYLVDDSWSAISVTNLTIIGEPGTIIKHSAGPTAVVRTASENLVSLATGGSIRLKGVTFKDFGRVIDIADQAAITLLDVDNCIFDGCVEPISGEANSTASFVSTVFPVGDVERCVIQRCTFKNIRMCCVRIRSSHLKSLLVVDNLFDGWQVAPSTGQGWRGLHIWDGFPATGGDIDGLNWKNRNTIVQRNVFRNIVVTDTTAPVLVAVLVQGSYCDVSYNHFENITNSNKSQTSECIYTKSRFCNVSHNTFFNAGQYQGAIACKGYPELTSDWAAIDGASGTRDNFGYAIKINHNRFYANDSTTKPRLAISCWAGGHVQISNNYIQGYTIGIMCQINSNVESLKFNWDISHNTIRDCFSYEGADANNEFYASGFNDHIVYLRSPTGIWCGTGMSYSKINHNYIENVRVNYTGGNAYGLLIGTAGFSSIGLRIIGNDIRNISKGLGSIFDCVLLQPAATKPFYDLRFENNSLRDASIGVRFWTDAAAVAASTGFFRGNSSKGLASSAYTFFTNAAGKPAGIISEGNFRWGSDYTAAPSVVLWDGATQPWTMTNKTIDRVLDCNSTNTDELADVLATLIDDLKAVGIARPL